MIRALRYYRIGIESPILLEKSIVSVSYQYRNSTRGCVHSTCAAQGGGGVSALHTQAHRGEGGSRPCTHVHVGENTQAIVINFITVQGGGVIKGPKTACVLNQLSQRQYSGVPIQWTWSVTAKMSTKLRQSTKWNQPDLVDMNTKQNQYRVLV